MIEVDGLTKYYGERKAIDGISFQVSAGEVLGFLGPNGAGKTTTMRILTGFLPASHGIARIAGFDVLGQSLQARKNIGYLPESTPLYTDMGVRDYLDFMAGMRGLSGKRKSQRIEYVMDICHVADVANKLIGRLSKGYKQRVGLAQALISDPPVLILDEPTAGLDPKQIIETRELIKRLGREHTIILSTHILPEVSVTCNRVIIINEGKVVAVDTPDNLTRRLKGAERIELEIRGPREDVLKCLRAMPGVSHVEHSAGVDVPKYFVEAAVNKDVREHLAATVVNKGWGLLQLRSVGMSLEEVFLKLTTSEEIVG